MRPKIFDLRGKYTFKSFISDLLSGLTVASVTLPLGIILAIASGVEPVMGVLSSAVAAFACALLGGGQLGVSGPAVILTSVCLGVCSVSGPEGLVLSTLLGGVLLILLAAFKLGRLINCIPPTVLAGFTAGTVIALAIGQIKDLFGLSYAPGTVALLPVEKLAALFKNATTVNLQALLIGGLSLAILLICLKINKKIPGALIAILVTTVLIVGGEHLAKSGLLEEFHCSVSTVGHLYHIEAGFPSLALDFSSLTLTDAPAILLGGVAIALLSGMESLCTLSVLEEEPLEDSSTSTELFAQGIGNICAGLLGGLPVASSLERGLLNLKSGGKTPLSGIIAAILLFLVLVALMPFFALIPLPTVAAILLVAVLRACCIKQWKKLLKNATQTEGLLFFVTLLLTVILGTALAAVAGTILSLVLSKSQAVKDRGQESSENPSKNP